MTRSDIHSPKNIDPANYEFVDFFDTDVSDFAMAAAMSGAGVESVNFMVEMIKDYSRKNTSSNVAYPGNINKCDHCGQHIRYVAMFQHINGDYLSIGQNCAEETMRIPNRMTLEAKRVRDAAKKASTLKSAAKKFPEAVEIIRSHRSGELDYFNDFIDDVACRFVTTHVLSENQARAIVKTNNRQMEWAKQKENRKVQDEQNESPVIEGKIEIIGEVVSKKTIDGFYGLQHKMLVLDDRGFKVWGTQPQSLIVIDDKDGQRSLGRGDRVSFNANVKKSDRDECFGFFSRPTKAKVI